MSAFSYLVGDMDELLASWERAPYVSSPPRDLNDIFSLETVEALLRSGVLPLPCIRLLRDGVVLPVGGLGRPAQRGSAKRERLADAAAVIGAVAEGATLVIEELQVYFPELADLTRALTEQSGYPVYSAAFLSPADARGLNPHYDIMSVFIRQLDGSKLWRVAEPIARWPVTEWTQAHAAQATDTVLEVELKAGQCLYVPRGFIHSGVATSDASVHVSIGLIPPTWGAVLRQLANSALGEELFREALPYRFHALEPAEQRRLLIERMGQLTERLGLLAWASDPAAALAGAARPTAASTESAPGSLRSALTGRC
jgi:bifunctional lysine-specific demethylase and histidyl-hydroxylase NO66